MPTADHHGASASTRYGVAAGAALVLGGFLVVSVIGAWHPLRPQLVCVEPLGNGQTAAYFGYSNELDEPINLPIGEDNQFSPGDPDRKQPVAFPAKVQAGSKREAFAVAFAGASLKWELGGREVVAYRDSLQCPLPPKPAQRDDVAWVKPKPVEPPPPEPPKPEEPKPEPPKPEEPPPEPPKPAAVQPRVKPKNTPPPVQKPPEPVALQLEGLTNLGSGVVMNTGDTTSLGDPARVPTKENTQPQAKPDVVEVGGTGTGTVEVKRVAPKVKLRPKGEWPADAPPRAGAVLVKLSLLVGTDGNVKQVRVVKSAGAIFDREAKRVGLQAVFEPAKVGDEAVEQWVPWVVEFTPDEG